MMLLPELVEQVGGVKPGVVAQLPGDRLERARRGRQQQLLLAHHRLGVFAQVLGQFHVDRAAACGGRGVVIGAFSRR